ncbi:MULTISPECIES: hypothetical protein [Cyanophyceae]|uniref:hypothetical protein n=1 Tax=Cyanophyceae TaxID=3028117 RepID=UPI001686230E|nr:MULTISPECIES: hypothetical protein [Cyanophyceae]MBD1917857.1 hypothetical protein [Phormidium sp. FACHB-77]MBD2032975.1 hypothetical protein [Phormidium sp. FACHB-322]MBD2051723.1 hypothetical protein [Leptolyngbya sp. FACHB-60]
MPKLIDLGIACLALMPVGEPQVPPAALQLPIEIAQPTAPFVADLCPQVTWADGFRIGEMVPLAPAQYHPATVIALTPLRSDYSFEGAVITDLAVGTRVTVTGEVWDMGCNQWMAIPGAQQPVFIHGNALLNL